MKILSFEWKDAFANTGWFDRRQLKHVVGETELWCHTAGFLIKKTRKQLIVCTSWMPGNEKHMVREKFCAIHKIPMTWVRNYKVLGRTKK